MRMCDSKLEDKVQHELCVFWWLANFVLPKCTKETAVFAIIDLALFSKQLFLTMEPVQNMRNLSDCALVRNATAN